MRTPRKDYKTGDRDKYSNIIIFLVITTKHLSTTTFAASFTLIFVGRHLGVNNINEYEHQ